MATLDHSWCAFVTLFLHERQPTWLQEIEAACRCFGGTPHEVLVDDVRTRRDPPDTLMGEVGFNERSHAFCR